MPRSVLLIVNPHAGGGRASRVLPEYEAALTELGLEYRVERTHDLPHAQALARDALANDEVAAALGGDGLAGAVAAELRGTAGVLGVLPGGRGNDFARVLGIPADPAGACAVLRDGTERLLDLGEVLRDGVPGSVPFIGIASCGFDSDANRIANEARLIKGNLVYTYAALRALAQWKEARFEITLDGEPLKFTGYTVACANSKAYGGGMYIAPDADLEDGLLDVVLIGHVGKFRFLTRLPQIFKGRHVENVEVDVRRAREVTITASRPFTAYADGDPIGDLPLTVRAVPRAIRVLAPAP